MVIPNASHTKTLIPTCFVSPIQRGARDPFLCFSQTTWPAHSVLHLAMSWESRNGVETSKLSAPLPCALACRSTYHHPRVEKQNSATAVSKLSHLGAAEKQHSCSSPEKWAFPRIGLPWPPERSFLCHQCPHLESKLDNLTQMIYSQFWTKNIFIPLLIRIHQIQYGTLSP